MKKGTFAAALVIIFSIIFFGNLRADNLVVIKNGNTLITYKVNYSTSDETAYDITTNTYTGTDVATLMELDVPKDAWPWFASNQYLIFSSVADQYQKENVKLQEELNSSIIQSTEFENSRTLWRSLFWIITIVSFLVITILTFSLIDAKKKVRKASHC